MDQDLDKDVLPRVNILGVGVHAIDMPQVIKLVDSAVSQSRKGYVCVTGVHGIMEAQKDAAFKAILNRSFLTTPDGMPTVWVGRLNGFSQMRRFYGPDFMLRVCALSLRRRCFRYPHWQSAGFSGLGEKRRFAVAASAFAGAFSLRETIPS